MKVNTMKIAANFGKRIKRVDNILSVSSLAVGMGAKKVDEGEGEGPAGVYAALFWRQFEGATALPARLLQLIHQYLISIDNSFSK